ncbi:MAG: cytochrome c oxidase accessory protein CcoG, partial [Xanthomonadales bacterium]|nr:cytochrome c oxidase accessory protein CcoG [Xanthomonadales bacterium]
DKAPWTMEKILRKCAKQGMWVTFAAWTGFTFVGFFTPIRDIWGNLLALNLGPWESFWMAFYAFATYGNAGFLREQVCKYMCPYARFQSAMFDHDTLIISYDDGRGEPRGGRRKTADKTELGLGDCIDCTLCVQVCPTGIDIRQGLQYECIACAACVDVCNQVMDKMDYAPGLIRYTTENALHGKPSRIVRPRVLIYAVILVALLIGVITSITNRVPLRAELIRDRNALYRELPDGRIENRYTLKLINMDQQPHRYDVEVRGLDNVEIELSRPLQLDAEEVGTFSLGLRAQRQQAAAISRVEVVFRAMDDPVISRSTPARVLVPDSASQAES